MAPRFIMVDPTKVVESDEHPMKEEGFIFPHLKRYCAHFDPLPVITVTPKAGKLVVVRGHIYLRIAKELGRKLLRAVVSADVSGVPGILGEISRETLEKEQQRTVVDGWHVFFLGDPEPAELIESVKRRFMDYLSRSLPNVVPVDMSRDVLWNYDPTGPCIELKFPTPVANAEWAAEYHALCIGISSELARIVSYQGRRFVSA